MKITAEFNSVREILDFARAFENANFKPAQITVPRSLLGGIIAEPTLAMVGEDAPEVIKVVKPEVKPEVKTDEVEKAVDAPGENIQAEAHKVEASKVTKEMVRALFAKLIQAGKQKEAKELTLKYGANKIPDLKEEDYAAVYKEAEGLL